MPALQQRTYQKLHPVHPRPGSCDGRLIEGARTARLDSGLFAEPQQASADALPPVRPLS